jgi:ectoine hydroxylase-related dioxygenase (phytanoyl-CoA dioxygenase family)
MMISVEVSGVFNQPRLYGNSLLMPVLQGLLGARLIMGGFGAVVSLPGAKSQHIHRDHPELFGKFDHEHRLPSFALTVAIPLIDMNSVTGTTRMIPGSHRVDVERAKAMAWLDPIATVGSVLVWDYLLYHGGTANMSDRIRPLLYFSYCRPWFIDSENYSTHDPVTVPAPEFARMPDELKHLFQWAMPRTPPDWSKMSPDMPCPCWSGLAFKNCHGRLRVPAP